MNISEADFQKRIVDFARWAGWRVFHPLPARRGSKVATWFVGDAGFPDLVLARDGIVMFVEVKSEKGRLTADQVLWAQVLGDLWRVWRPSDWDEIVATLGGRVKV